MEEIDRVMRAPAASRWLRDALRGALARDPVDAANDEQLLARLLDARCAGVLAAGKDPHGCP